jgi:hypothetical protein
MITNQQKSKQKSIQFLENTKSFIELFSDICGDNPKINIDLTPFSFATNYLDSLINSNNSQQIENIIHNFINNTHKYWNDILDKNYQYFIDNSDILFSTTINNNPYSSFLTQIKQLFIDNLIDQDDMYYIWDHLHSLIRLSIYFIHYNRDPHYNTENKRIYKNKFFCDFKIGNIINKWNNIYSEDNFNTQSKITLDWPN